MNLIGRFGLRTSSICWASKAWQNSSPQMIVFEGCHRMTESSITLASHRGRTTDTRKRGLRQVYAFQCLHMREQFLSSQKKSSDRSFSHLKEGSILQRAFGNTRRSNRLKTQASNGVHLENGKIPNSDVFANPGSGTVISQLQEEISELRMLVTAQGNMMRRQVESIQQLQHELYGRELEKSQANTWATGVNPFEAQRYAGIGDRRFLGKFDARFHSTTKGATPKDYRVLPRRIILVRHAESEGNIDNFAYTYVPDPQVPLTERGIRQAKEAGEKLKNMIFQEDDDHMLYFYMSPYKRSLQTYEALASVFSPDNIQGCQEEVQLREQDFGNFQDVAGKQNEKAERLRFGRFFYRFPNGESGADVYDRMTIFEDHMIRDINAGKFAGNTSLVLVTHGLALRVFLMRWFHWSVDQFLDVYNPPNAEPLIMERVPEDGGSIPDSEASWIHTKALYKLTDESRDIIKGCTAEMCITSCLPTGQLPTQDCGAISPWNPFGPAHQSF